VFGYSAEEAVGQPITIVIPHDRQDEERLILTRIRQGERIELFRNWRKASANRRSGSPIKTQRRSGRGYNITRASDQCGQVRSSFRARRPSSSAMAAPGKWAASSYLDRDGGPTVLTPSRQGFGSRIISQLIDQQRGKTRFDWRRQGLVCRNHAPSVRYEAIAAVGTWAAVLCCG
jgi:two-component sensor histidine kinase